MRDGDEIAVVAEQRLAIRLHRGLRLSGAMIGEAEEVPRARFAGQQLRGEFEFSYGLIRFSFPQ